ncbi:hypothetical protein [Streptomyces niveus]|uniref:Uncharacterized protein n=1 Tax=Streptomyces niveus TaxID=193462 RepID=A0A1U9R0S9_STRNV|nr:hypothetical protein [Streptomyces niveus]AQU70128.1 hypothetical protein BBN63_32080 [Streptomyces niveus]
MLTGRPLRADWAHPFYPGSAEGPGGPPTCPGPILDGHLAVETAEITYRAGRQIRVTLLIGTTRNDFIGFVATDSKDALFAQFGTGAARARAANDPHGTAPPLCFSRSCKRAAGLRARHDYVPLSNG